MFNSKSQKGFAHPSLFFIPILAIIVVIGLHVASSVKKGNETVATHSSSPQQPQEHQEWWQNDAVTKKLPACIGSQYLTSQVSTDSALGNITPLGNIGPPSHIYPTDHIYMNLKTQMTTTPGRQPTVPTQMFAPADVHVVGATATEYYTNGVLQRSDWEYAYYPCSQVGFYNAHILQLAGGLKDAVAKSTKECLGDQKEGNNEYKTCNYRFDYQAKAGEMLGSAGGTTTNAGYDWGAFDLRTPKLKYINQGLTNGGVGMVYNMVCPLDYFTPALKAHYYAYLPNRSDPKCGTPMQDLTGTIQGNWRTSDAKQNPPDWPQQLSIVHDNVHPDEGVIATGGTFTDAGAMYFSPIHSGKTNREPSEVKPSSNIYCYQQTPNIPTYYQMGGKIILQLAGSSLKIEHQNGSCGSQESFQKPTVYVR